MIKFIANEIYNNNQIHVQTRLQQYTQPPLSGLERGFKLIETIRQNLQFISSTYRERTVQQARLHELFIQACSPIIFGHAIFNMNRTRIDDYFGLKYKGGAICQAPRRFGKTEAVLYFIVALLVSIPNCQIVCYSTLKEACLELKDKCAKLFRICYPDIALKYNNESKVEFKKSNNKVNFYIPSDTGNAWVFF